MLTLRVLTWNLFHGRAVPGAGHDLFDAFATALAGWEWDVALLQEVPPWWPPQLAETLDCDQHTVLTSRNGLLPIRRALAIRWPDLMRSGGGGANAILVRGDRIVTDRSERLCRRPERRWVHGVDLACGAWVGNLHLTAHDTEAAQRDLARALDATRRWARERRLPIVLGGDFNLRQVEVEGLTAVASCDVDHVLVGSGVQALGPMQELHRERLSDHVPIVVSLGLVSGTASGASQAT